ncbi:MAG: hypothetical protein WCO23_03510 [bacterium]
MAIPIIPGLKQTTLISLLRPRESFAIAAVEMTTSPTGISIYLENTIQIADDKTSRKILENLSVENVWRWAAGGIGVIIDTLDGTYFICIHKDADAPSYADCDTLPSGLSIGVDELIHPDILAKREANEELIIMTPNGRIMIEEEDFIETGAEKTIQIHSPFGVNEVRGIICLDESTNGIDYLRVARKTILFAIADIKITDGELNGKLDREIRIYKLDEIPSDGKFTPVTTAVVSAIKHMLHST